MYYELAQCHLYNGQLERAISLLSKLRGIYYNTQGFRSAYYPKSFYLLGKIYEQKGEPELAIKNYAKLLELWKNADEDLLDLIDARERLAKLKAQLAR